MRPVSRSIDLHQFLEAIDRGPAQLIGRARRARLVQRGGDGGRDVADKDRLEAGVAAADQGQGGRNARQRGEFVEEAVLRPEHDGRPQDDGGREGLAHAPFAFRLGLGIVGSRIRCRRRWPRHGPVRRRPAAAAASAILPAPSACTSSKALAALEQDAGQIDDGLGALQRRARPGPASVTSHLTKPIWPTVPSGRRKKARLGWRHGDLDAPAGLGQRPHRVAAQKARAAENRDHVLCFHGENLRGLSALVFSPRRDARGKPPATLARFGEQRGRLS